MLRSHTAAVATNRVMLKDRLFEIFRPPVEESISPRGGQWLNWAAGAHRSCMNIKQGVEKDNACLGNIPWVNKG